MRGVSTVALAVAASITATGNSASVDVGQYQGLALLVLNTGPTNAGTSTVKLQHSDDGTSGWSDTGDAFTATTTVASYQELVINADKLKKFVRVVDTLAGASSVVRSVSLVGRKKYA